MKWIILLLTMLTVSIVSEEPTIDEMILSMQGECDAIGEIVNSLGDNDENPYQSINKVCKDGLNAIKYVYTDQHGIKGKAPLQLKVNNQQVEVPRAFLRSETKRNEFKARFDDLIKNKHKDNPKDAQKIVNKIITCHKYKTKNEFEKCAHNLFCMKKKYILDNRINFEENKVSFPIMYKGVEAFTQSPPDMETGDCPEKDDEDNDDDESPAATDPPPPERKEPETKATDSNTEKSSADNKEAETEPPKEVRPKKKKKKVVKKTGDTTLESSPSDKNGDDDDSDGNEANNGSTVKKVEENKPEPMKPETKTEDSKPENPSPLKVPEKIVADTKKKPEVAETEPSKEEKPVVESPMKETKKGMVSESATSETKVDTAKGSKKTTTPDTSNTPGSKVEESVSVTNSQQDSSPKDSTKDISSDNDKDKTEKPASDGDIEYEPVEDEKPNKRRSKKPLSVMKSMSEATKKDDTIEPTKKPGFFSSFFSKGSLKPIEATKPAVQEAEPPAAVKNPPVQVTPTPATKPANSAKQPITGSIQKHTDSDYINPYEVSLATRLVIRSVLHVMYSTVNSWRRKPLDSNGRLKLSQLETLVIDSIADRISNTLMKVVFNERAWMIRPSSDTLKRQGAIFQPVQRQLESSFLQSQSFGDRLTAKVVDAITQPQKDEE